MVPTHQGRGAENLISRMLIKPGDFVPGNMYFTTTRLHQELAGGTFVDVIIPEAHDPRDEHPFKGNVDLEALETSIQQGRRRSACPTSPSRPRSTWPAGSPSPWRTSAQVRDLAAAATASASSSTPPARSRTPTSSSSASRATRDTQRRRDPAGVVLLHRRLHDERQEGLAGQHRRLARLNDDALFEEASNLVVVYEGLHTYGGMAGRDMEAMARGIVEVGAGRPHPRPRSARCEYLGNKLIDWGVPIVRPIGGHAVFLDAKAFYPHIPQDEFPAQTLAAELYVDSGVRAMERGIVSAGRDEKTGEAPLSRSWNWCG